jgi:hypothetical protein
MRCRGAGTQKSTKRFAPVAHRYWVLTELRDVSAGSVARQQVAEFVVASLEQNLCSRDTVLLSR